MPTMRTLTTITAVAAALNGVAATVVDTDSVPNILHEVVVTATRTPRLLKETPVLTRVINFNDLRHYNVANVTELLQGELPGAEFSLAMNQQTQFNLSGFSGNDLLFLVDGQRLAGETLDNVDYSRLNLLNVERIEIVKGAASTLYGSNAVGGVVNIISRVPRKAFEARAKASYGTHNNQTYGLVAGTRHRAITNSLEAQYNSCDEIKLPNPGDFTRVFAGRAVSVADKLGWTPAEGVRLTARAGFFNRERDQQADERERYRDYSASAALSVDKIGLTAGHSFDQYEKWDVDPVASQSQHTYTNRRNDTSLKWDRTIRRGDCLTVGGDFNADYLMSYQFGGGDHSRYNGDLFAQYEWKAAERLSLTGGLRYDQYPGKASLSPKLSAMLTMGDCSLRLNYAKGFRMPTLKELYMDFDMAGIFHIYGNEDLKPETSHNFSLAAQYIRRDMEVNLSLGHSIITNRIAYLWDYALDGQHYVNTSRVNVTTVDASARFYLGGGFRAKAGATYTRESRSGDAVNPSPARPFAANARVDYSHRFSSMVSAEAGLSGRYLSRVTGDVVGLVGSHAVSSRDYQGYGIVKLSAAATLDSRYKLTVDIDNLLNYVPDYYYYNSPLTTGTALTVTLAADI